MTLAQQMIVIAPADGPAPLSAEQRGLLVGKAHWVRTVYDAGIHTVPTICLTRAAWEALNDERQVAQSRLRTAWVATLSRLVPKGGAIPALVVRTSATSHATGLASAAIGIPPPASERESTDPAKALGRAISAAFASYGTEGPVWSDATVHNARADEIVLVQAVATGELGQFLTRDIQTGAIGPAPINGQSITDKVPGATAEIVELLDSAAGHHMLCLVAVDGEEAQFVSARLASASAEAELEAAVDRAERGIWSTHEAVNAIGPGQLPRLLHPRLHADPNRIAVAKGLGVSPGAASGRVVFNPEDAARLGARGVASILVMLETGPTDVEGMQAATGILTARGGMTSHAAVIARITGRPCVAGVRSLQIDEDETACLIGNQKVNAGDMITIDGSDGQVFLRALPLSQPHMGGAISRLLDWSDGSRTIQVRTNAETIEAAKTALNFGCEGIGLARSEHMFFSQERMVALRRLILSENEADRARALEGLVQYQTGDYADLFSVMQGRPVTVRLFDPPLHEFLPRLDDDLDETAQSLGLSTKALRQRLDRLVEVNPMLGHRGCRLVITSPEILHMQMRALFAGANKAAARQEEPVALEVMVPFVSSVREVLWVKNQVMEIATPAIEAAEGRINFSFGTMIELPRAALRAGEIAHAVDFFSFGTNDLTQTTFGISRDDAPAFLASYQRRGLYDADPFVSLDQVGVGELINMAIQRGRGANPALVIGICGEHAGDPKSLEFFAELNIDYVSCSPYRVPVARLSLGQAGHK